MSDEIKKDPGPITKPYELTAGAIAILEDVLPLGSWYKDEQKQGLLLTRAIAACEALPDIGSRPKPTKEEEQDVYDARVEKWRDTIFMFNWTDKQKDAAKVCVRFYLKQAAFGATATTASLLKFFELIAPDDEL